MMGLRRRLSSTFAAGLVVALIFGVGYFVGSQEAAQAHPALQGMATPIPGTPTPQPPADVADYLDLFREAWDLIQREYVGRPVDPTQLMHGAIRGMLQTLDDPHSGFLDPAAYRRQQTALRGVYGGIGATIELQEGQPTIVAPFEGYPAARAGLQTGDVVLRVDEREVGSLSLSEVIDLIRGPAGTSVQLTILRRDDLATETLSITVMRERIAAQAVTLQLADGDVAIIEIRRFLASTPRQLAEMLRRAQEQQAGGIVLDLRDNPGGLLGASVAVASQFLPADTTVVIEQLGNGEQEPHKARRDGRALDIPLVVLVNEGTASGAEIVAGALADHDRAILVGETTFGKGTVQILHELSDGSAVRITTARWLTPSGHVIQGVGLTPEEVVIQTADDHAAGRDPPMVRAREILRSPAAPPTPAG